MVSPRSIFGLHQLSPSEVSLRKLRIPYKRQQDGTLHVHQSVFIRHAPDGRLPDLSDVVVHGSFYCTNVGLTSLEGSPRQVMRTFGCWGNRLTSLKGAPSVVNGEFSCHKNQLTSLVGAPTTVGRNFNCFNNALASLEHLPPILGGMIMSDFGNFFSLKDVPISLQPSRLKEEEDKKQAVIDAEIAAEAEAIAAKAEERASVSVFPSGTVVQGIKLDL